MATMPSVLTSLKSILTITSTMAALQKITMMTCLPLLHVADAAHSSLPASITTAFYGKPPATAFQARPLSRPSCLQELRCRSQSDSALSLFSSSSRGGKFGRALVRTSNNSMYACHPHFCCNISDHRRFLLD